MAKNCELRRRLMHTEKATLQYNTDQKWVNSLTVKNCADIIRQHNPSSICLVRIYKRNGTPATKDFEKVD